MFKAATYTYYFSLTAWDMGKFFFWAENQFYVN